LWVAIKTRQRSGFKDCSARRGFNNKNPTRKMKFQKFLAPIAAFQALKYTPMDPFQVKFDQFLKSDQIKILLVMGSAGTGKTLLSCQQAVHELKTKKKQKIVISRPLVSVDKEEIGFLPGDMNEKLLPWTMPIFDHMGDFLETSEIKRLVHESKLEISPLGYMRGRTFKNSYIILDEAQNTTPTQMKMFLSRIGENSKMVVNGDLQQSDIKDGINGLEDFVLRIRSKYEENKSEMYQDGFAIVDLGRKNTYRHPIIQKVVEIYDEN